MEIDEALLAQAGFEDKAEAIMRMFKAVGVTTIAELENAFRVLGPRVVGVPTNDLVYRLAQAALNPPPPPRRTRRRKKDESKEIDNDG